MLKLVSLVLTCWSYLGAGALEMLDHLERMGHNGTNTSRSYGTSQPDGTPGEAVPAPRPGQEESTEASKSSGRLKMVMISGLHEMQLNRPRRPPGKKAERKKKEGAKRIANVLRLPKVRGRGN